ncbi:MAG: hypothetical protein ABIR32_12900 [Ilumatobacteraceae bacterium]
MATGGASEQGAGDHEVVDQAVDEGLVDQASGDHAAVDQGLVDQASGDHAAGEHNGATSGAGLVRLDLIGTAVFAVSAVAAAIVFTNSIRIVGVVVALVLFAIGVVAFLWSYWSAVQRSRTDNIAVAQLYFLASGSTPRRVQLTMNLALLAQVVIGLGTAIARSTTDGRAGSTLAFGILVPMFGLGLNGLWCSRYGQFAPRRPAPEPSADGNSRSVRTSDDEMEQNSHHG